MRLLQRVTLQDYCQGQVLTIRADRNRATKDLIASRSFLCSELVAPIAHLSRAYYQDDLLTREVALQGSICHIEKLRPAAYHFQQETFAYKLKSLYHIFCDDSHFGECGHMQASLDSLIARPNLDIHEVIAAQNGLKGLTAEMIARHNQNR